MGLRPAAMSLSVWGEGDRPHPWWQPLQRDSVSAPISYCCGDTGWAQLHPPHPCRAIPMVRPRQQLHLQTRYILLGGTQSATNGCGVWGWGAPGGQHSNGGPQCPQVADMQGRAGSVYTREWVCGEGLWVHTRVQRGGGAWGRR